MAVGLLCSKSGTLRVAARWLLVAILLSMLGTARPFLHSLTQNGEMLPMNPLVAEGDTLVLNCTLTGYKGNNTASNFTFRAGSKPLPSKYVTVLSNVTAELRYPNISMEEGNFAYYCDLPEKKMIGLQYIHVGRPPTIPVVEKCVVYNWENMTCSWQPAHQEDTKLDTRTSLYWAILLTPEEEQMLFNCPHVKDNTCTWLESNGSDSFRADMIYYITMEAINRLGERRAKPVAIHTAKIVKPNPVRSLRATNVTNTSLLLSWESPKPGQDLLYNVSYTSNWNSIAEELMVGDTQVKLEGLVPFTQYRITITVKPLVEGFWSSDVQLVVDTNPALPGSNPPVTNGGFEVRDCGENCNDILFYWQGIPRQAFHAGSFRYRVSIHHLQECNSSHFQQMPSEIWTSADQRMVNVTSSKHCPLVFVVRASNELGDALDRPQAVIVEGHSSLPTYPTSLLSNARDDRTVHVQWEESNSEVTSHTVFWCKGSHINNVCQGQLYWETVPAPQSNLTVTLDKDWNYLNFLFGVSSEIDTDSSGILWNDCTFDYRKLSPPPSEIETKTPTEHNSLIIKWLKPSCSQGRGYIINYTIFYCPVDDQDNCNGPEKNESIAGGESHYTIHDLQPRKRYRIQMDSVTLAGHSNHRSKVIFGTPTETWLTASAIAGLVIAFIIVDILVVMGVITIVMRCRKCHKWYVSGMKITLPDEKLSPTISTSSDLPLATKEYYDYPDLDAKWFKYTTQTSMESSSADSGHGSLCEHNLLNGRRESSISEETDQEQDEVFQDEYPAVKRDSKRCPRVTAVENGYVQVGIADTPPKTKQPEYDNQPPPSVSQNSRGAPTAINMSNPSYGKVDIDLSKQKSSFV